MRSTPCASSVAASSDAAERVMVQPPGFRLTFVGACSRSSTAPAYSSSLRRNSLLSGRGMRLDCGVAGAWDREESMARTTKTKRKAAGAKKKKKVVKPLTKAKAVKKAKPAKKAAKAAKRAPVKKAAK